MWGQSHLILHVEQAAHLASLDLADHVTADGGAGDDVTRDGKVQLADFLLQGHLAHQVVDKLVHSGLVSGKRAHLGTHCGQDQEQAFKSFNIYRVLKLYANIVIYFGKVKPSLVRPCCTSGQLMKSRHSNPVR